MIGPTYFHIYSFEIISFFFLIGDIPYIGEINLLVLAAKLNNYFLREEDNIGNRLLCNELKP